MAPRRLAPSSSAPSQQDLPNPTPGVSTLFAFPRSNSPSSAITGFLSKPTKWFSRSSSSPRLSNGSESRPFRKPKISTPQDPRPILNSFHSVGSGSRSVLDLSVTRTPGSLDFSTLSSQNSRADSPRSTLNSGIGDLRVITSRPWSRSADDLGKISNFSPTNPSFHDRVAQYRQRANSSASVPPNSPSQDARSAGPVASFSPHSLSNSVAAPIGLNPSGFSISISAPNAEDSSLLLGETATPSPTHIRSQSYAPRSPKLYNAKFDPSSPRRKGSAPAAEIEHDRDALLRDKPRLNTSHRGTMAFNFGVPGSKTPSGPIASTVDPVPSISIPSLPRLMPPPAIMEPPVWEGKFNRRKSQQLHHSGFINRLSNFPPGLLNPNRNHAIPVPNKGWKPFKLEAKGSKLYFYKPPGDRSAAIKELFVTRLVSPEEDEGADLERDDLHTITEVIDVQKERSPVSAKRRAFWGRSTHPDIIRNADNRLDKGTLPALVHEAVFATTFFPMPAEDVQQEEPLANRRITEWQEFASSILLALPLLVGHAKFESELTRCCSFLVDGAAEEAKDSERSRVVWLAREYLRFHGSPADTDAWDRWKAETIPHCLSDDHVNSGTSGMPVSSSTQALFVPSLQIPLAVNGSPNMHAFSSSPKEGPNTLPMNNKLNGSDDNSEFPGKGSPTPKAFTSHSSQPESPVHCNRLVKQDQEFPSADVLLTVDHHLIARSLGIFHRTAFEEIPENLTADHVFVPATLTRNSATALPRLFLGSQDQPHWLTACILLHVLDPLTSPQAPSRSWPYQGFDERSAHTLRVHARAEIISLWTKVGELCRLSGDECSWRAVQMALCSRPIARLQESWRCVDGHISSLVHSWINPGPDGEMLMAKEPRLTPWGGEAQTRIREELDKAEAGHENNNWAVEPMLKLRGMFEGLRTAFSRCPRHVNLPRTHDDLDHLVNIWRVAAKEPSPKSTVSKFPGINQYMARSFAAEPRRKGLFEPYHWSRPSQSSCSFLIPLLFPEPLPSLSLLDRNQILRGRQDVDLHSPTFPFSHGVSTSLWPDAFGVKSASRNLGTTVIPVFGGDLLLAVQTGPEISNPSQTSLQSSHPPTPITDGGNPEKAPSRSPSIRVKPGSSHGLDRKISVARRSSLPAISNRQSLVSSEFSLERPLRVVVQAGLLDVLIGILVHGLQNVTVSVADDNGEISLREGKTRELVLDQNEFARVWWNTFRSFVTPLVFFELLRKIFMNAHLEKSPSTPGHNLNVGQIRSGVLMTIKEWLIQGGGSQDVLDDVQLFDALRAFLQCLPQQGLQQPPGNPTEANTPASIDLDQTRIFLLSILDRQTMRPSIRRLTMTRRSLTPTRTKSLGKNPPDIDHIDAERLVDNLDAIASAAFNNVTEEDLFVAADVLEVQSADRSGWLLARDPVLQDDFVEVQTLYSHLEEVETSHTISELGQGPICCHLPDPIRGCLRMYFVLRKWLIAKITSLRLGLRARQERLDLFLRAIEVTRLRGTGTGLATKDQPCVRSFVEAVLASAVLSIESRLYTRAWQNVAALRGGQFDTLSSLLAKPMVKNLVRKDALAIDIGWIMERLLELVCIPDLIDSQTPDGQTLINFDKRRHIHNLFTSAVSIHQSRPRRGIDRSDVERFRNIEKEVNALHFDIRSIKEEAAREALQANAAGHAPPGKKVFRPFQRITASQIDKIRRDKALRDRVAKERRQEQLRLDRREDVLNKALHSKMLPLAMHKQHRAKKSVSTAFFQLMRPLSTAFTADSHSHTAKRTPKELDFAHAGKPTLVLNLINAEVVPHLNNERSFTFRLDTEDGGHCLLQAVDKKDMNKWVDTIKRISQDGARRRSTYMDISVKPQVVDDIHSGSVNASGDPKAAFGVNLQVLLEREAPNGEVLPGAIPSVIEQCLAEVELRGLTEVGIYRVAGATSEVNALRDAFNRGERAIQPSSDIYAICDLVKAWFRVLPEAIFPPSEYHEVITAMKSEQLETRLSSIRRIVQSLPRGNVDLLKRVAEHLDRVTDFEEHNHMSAEALSIVFSPNLLRAPKNDFAMILANMGHTHQLVKALITHYHVIFDDADALEVDQSEDDVDVAVPEQQEEETSVSLSSAFS